MTRAQLDDALLPREQPPVFDGGDLVGQDLGGPRRLVKASGAALHVQRR
jgi:hypothetical protein